MDVVELAAAARHGCKVCGKSFLCGRSLGGHMRSHISLGEAAMEAHADDEPRRASPNGGRSCSGGVVGYGLRENPRKTRRLSDFANEEDGGHGVCDGDGEGEQHKACRECGKLFSSWRSLFGHMRSHAPGGGRYRDGEGDVDVEEEGLVVPVPEEAEAEEAEMVTPMEAAPVAAAPAALTLLSAPPRRRRRTMRVAAPAPTTPPPTPMLSGFEKEPEDVALCLLMLSRDTGMWSSPAKEEPFESAKKQAGFPRSGHTYNSNDDDDDPATLQHGDAKIKGRRVVAKSRKRGSPKQQRRDPVAVAPKRTRYECPGCGKAFSSYQALGGHRASHKRINASCSSPRATPAAASSAPPEPSAETYASFNTLSPSASPDSVAIGFGKPKDDEAVGDAKFECAVCFRVFASGQALGWHKRSHLMPAESDDVELYYVGGAVADHHEQQHSAGADHHELQHSAAADGFLDLNFPPAAPEEA